METQEKRGRYFFGFIAVGVVSLIGGILIFIFVVVPERESIINVPRDVQMIFTQVFSQEGVFVNETGYFNPALTELGVEQEDCRRYSCLLTLSKDRKSYTFRLSKEGRTWQIGPKSPVPQAVAQ
jgi:hypothetical protein